VAPRRKRSVFASVLEDDDFAFIQSDSEELEATEGDVCASCGSLRKFHEEGVDGSVVDSGKCRRFKEMK
jgi:hypothetical protein